MRTDNAYDYDYDYDSTAITRYVRGWFMATALRSS